jgi:hypothetical protein
MRSLAILLGGLWISIVTSSSLLAAGFTPGNLVVYRVGDGSLALANTGAKVFLDEFTTTGTLVQSLELNSTGAENKLIASGLSTSEGMLTISPNGQFITLTGYNSTIPAPASISTTTGATVNRTVGVVSVATGAVDLSTSLTDFSSANNPRSAVTDDGINLWFAGGAGGVRYATRGSTTSTQLSTTVTNIRGLNIFGGQLYTSTGSGTAVRVGAVGTGLPTTSGQTITNLPGFVTTGSPYGFFLADLDAGVAGVDTLYVASDDATALTKYSLVGGSWTSNGVIGVAADAYRGLTASVNGSTVNLFATRKGGSATGGGGELVSLTDSSGYNGAFAATPTVIASALTGQTAPNANTSFRGVVLIPNTGGGPSGVAGDYDNNGTVGVNDYTVWSNNFGGAITTLQNVNPTREAGPVDASDYTYWRDRVPGGGAVAAAAAVPEPATLLLALPLVGVAALRRRK